MQELTRNHMNKQSRDVFFCFVFFLPLLMSKLFWTNSTQKCLESVYSDPSPPVQLYDHKCTWLFLLAAKLRRMVKPSKINK